MKNKKFKILILILLLCLPVQVMAIRTHGPFVSSANIQNYFPGQINGDLQINGTLDMNSNDITNITTANATTVNSTALIGVAQIGTGSDIDLIELTDNKVTVNGSVDIDGDLNLVNSGEFFCGEATIGEFFQFRSATFSALLDANLTISAYAGKNISIEGVSFDGNDITTSGNLHARDNVIGLGDIEGLVVKYNDATTVSITSGWCEANGSFYELSADVTHNVTSLASGFDFHHIYIDDDASTAPNPVFIDSTTAPTWSDAKRGWYNGNDKRIGVVASKVGASTICFFQTQGQGKNISFETGVNELQADMASAMAPTTAWLTPDDYDGSSVTPIGAIKIKILISNTDAANNVGLYAASAEYATLQSTTTRGQFNSNGYNSSRYIAEFNLGDSRNIKIAGDDDDDNSLQAWCLGFTYSR